MAQKGSGSSSRGGSGQGPDDGQAGRLAPEVYRRRRMVAALAAVLLLVLVVVGVVAAVGAMLGPDEPAPAEEPQAAATAAVSREPFADFTPRGDDRPTAGPSPSATPTAEPPEECGPALVVTASTDRESYPPDVQPALTMTLENTGQDPCRVNAGTSQMVYQVISGRDTVFDSRHCLDEDTVEDRVITLEPGEEISTTPLTWDRARSLEGCTAPGEAAQPGYYRLVVSLGGRTSEPASFVLEE